MKHFQLLITAVELSEYSVRKGNEKIIKKQTHQN